MKITDLKPNEVIHCKTKEEAVRICGMMYAAGLRPGSFFTDNWDVHEENTCYDIRSDEAGHVALYVQDNYTIHPSELFRDDSSDEITEDGLRARGFSPSDLGGHYLQGAEWALHFTVSGNIELGIDSNWIATNCHTLTDIDHLIRLLGI